MGCCRSSRPGRVWLHTRFLFQLGLAVLKINQAALLASRDDDQVVRTLKNYFAVLDDHLPKNGEKRRTFGVSLLHRAMSPYRRD